MSELGPSKKMSVETSCKGKRKKVEIGKLLEKSKKMSVGISCRGKRKRFEIGKGLEKRHLGRNLSTRHILGVDQEQGSIAARVAKQKNFAVRRNFFFLGCFLKN